MLGFPFTKHGNNCVFVVVDQFSKMAILAPCKKCIIEEIIAKLLFECVWVILKATMDHYFKHG